MYHSWSVADAGRNGTDVTEPVGGGATEGAGWGPYMTAASINIHQPTKKNIPEVMDAIIFLLSAKDSQHSGIWHFMLSRQPDILTWMLFFGLLNEIMIKSFLKSLMDYKKSPVIGISYNVKELMYSH